LRSDTEKKTIQIKEIKYAKYAIHVEYSEYAKFAKYAKYVKYEKLHLQLIGWWVAWAPENVLSLHQKTSESYRQVEEIKAAEPEQEVVAPALFRPFKFWASTWAFWIIQQRRWQISGWRVSGDSTLSGSEIVGVQQAWCFKQERFSTLHANTQNMQNMQNM